MIGGSARAGHSLAISDPDPVDPGRPDELAVVVDAMRDLARGEPSVLLVEGEAGIGKTTLVDAALAHAPALGLSVFRGDAHEMEIRRPFGVLADALGVRRGAPGLRGQVADLLAPGVGAPTGSSGPLEFGFGERLVALVDELTTACGAVLVAEDLQWADPASLVALSRMVRQRPPLPVLVVGTARMVPRRAEVGHLIGCWTAQGARRLELGPLSAAAEDALVESRLGASPGPRLAARLRAAGGNPLFLTEIVRTLAHEGMVDIVADGRADVAGAPWPPSLFRAVLGRVGYLDARVRDLLGRASVLGASFDLADLAAICGQAVAECWAELRDALDAGLVTRDGDRLRFCHDVIAEALYVDLPGAVRSEIHLEAARVLADRGAPAVAVAEHYLRAEPAADLGAVGWLRQAGADQASLAPAAAAELLGAAVDRGGDSDPDHLEAVGDLGLVLVAAGRNVEGERALREALDGTVAPARREALEVGLTSSLLLRGDAAGALSEAEAVLSQPGLSEAGRGRFNAFAGLASLHLGRVDEAELLGRSAQCLAERVDDVPGQVQALCVRAQAAMVRCQPRRAVELARPAVELASRSGTSEAHEGLPDVMYALCLADADRFSDSSAALESGRRRTESFATPASAVLAHVSGAYGSLFSGSWDDALAELEAAHAVVPAIGSSGWAVEILCPRALIACWRGQLDDARAVLVQLETAGGEDFTSFYIGWPDWARAALLAAEGDVDAALDAQRAAWWAATGAAMVFSYRILGPPLARLAAELGQTDLSKAVATELEGLAERNPDVAGLAGAALRSRGLAEGAPDLLLDALAAYRASGRQPERAWCAEDAARFLARAGRRDEAVTAAHEALDLYGELGADGEAQRARAGWRHVGLRLGARGARARPLTGWAALTPTEVKVAALVAEQRSNPEIAQALYISRHTVATHVSHVLAKLAMTSRVELVAAAARGPLERIGEEPDQVR